MLFRNVTLPETHTPSHHTYTHTQKHTFAETNLDMHTTIQNFVFICVFQVIVDFHFCFINNILLYCINIIYNNCGRRRLNKIIY